MSSDEEAEGELAQAVEEEVVKYAIREMEFPAIKDPKHKETLRAVLRYEGVFKGVGLVKEEQSVSS